MIRLNVEQTETLSLSCMIMLPSDVMQHLALNCATTGSKTNHTAFQGKQLTDAQKDLAQALKNADVEDFNFSHILDPDSFNLNPGSNTAVKRTANNAFFTLITQYNAEAKKQGKPTIELEDIVDFIKSLPYKSSQYKVFEMVPTQFATGNDNAVCYEIKAPLQQFLKNRMDLGILNKSTAARIKSGATNDMYVKLIITPTMRRDTVKDDNGNDQEVYVVETGIQPISIHRDEDSANTKPKGNVRDDSWDRSEGLTPTDLKDATHRYINDSLARRKKEKEEQAKQDATS